MTNDEIAEWVTQRFDKAIRENVRREILITVILVLDVAVGLFLLFYGIKEGGVAPLVAGATCQAAIGWPFAKLMAIHRDNLYLKMLPALLRMADSREQKKFLYKLAEKLMARL